MMITHHHPAGRARTPSRQQTQDPVGLRFRPRVLARDDVVAPEEAVDASRAERELHIANVVSRYDADAA